MKNKKIKNLLLIDKIYNVIIIFLTFWAILLAIKLFFVLKERNEQEHNEIKIIEKNKNEYKI